jgi:WhiB family redox-sensing transcriptional regulator
MTRSPRPGLGWQQDAACKGMDQSLFFGPDDETRRQRNLRVRQAAAICIACPVWRPCREYSQVIHVPYGVWGGRDVEQAGGLMCRNGLHAMTAANTWTGPTGEKRCLACRNAADRRSRVRRQGEDVAA